MSEITPATPDENALRVAQLMGYFHAAVNAIRPGARFAMTVENDKMMLAFTDHGGQLGFSAIAIGDGPPLTPTNALWWTPPQPESWRGTIQVKAGMGSHESPLR